MEHDSIREILWKFPHSGREKQLETLATYFEAKKTQSKTEAAETANIHHTTGYKIEETYQNLSEQEKIELKKELLQKQIEDSDQIKTPQKDIPA